MLGWRSEHCLQLSILDSTVCIWVCATAVRICLAGKTTLLRDVVRLLANDFNKRVIVVDTSNEIGGDGAVPHTCLGKARRMSPTDRDQQHKVLLEAVQNHTPEVYSSLSNYALDSPPQASQISTKLLHDCCAVRCNWTLMHAISCCVAALVV